MSTHIERILQNSLLHYASKFRVIAVIGPRQAGKTTLVRKTFPNHKYFSLEDPDTLEAIQQDARAFLERNYGTPGIIFDEFQNDPKLLSYIQGIVDNNPRPGYFVLTGSHNFLMNQAISQSLAGRVAVLELLPLSQEELAQSTHTPQELNAAIFNGGYPDVVTGVLEAEEFYPNYVRTYVERDVRQLINIVGLTDFYRFIRLCAGRVGQLLDIASLANDCGISVPTAKAWLSILEASYIIFLLQPHFKNFNKRLIKSPKLYFYDTGLACWLLKIKTAQQLDDHYARGNLFESFILAEMRKKFYNNAQEPSMYFWRDSHGHEVDCILDYGEQLVPIEIKSSITVNSRYFDGLLYWAEVAAIDPVIGRVIYGGDKDDDRYGERIISWRNAAHLVKI